MARPENALLLGRHMEYRIRIRCIRSGLLGTAPKGLLSSRERYCALPGGGKRLYLSALAGVSLPNPMVASLFALQSGATTDAGLGTRWARVIGGFPPAESRGKSTRRDGRRNGGKLRAESTLFI